MRRRLFNFAAAVSLVFCLATVGLWVWSYRWINEFTLAVPHLDRIISGGGGVFIESVQHVQTIRQMRGLPDSSAGTTPTATNYGVWKLNQSGNGQRWEKRTGNYVDRRDLIRRWAWGPDLNRAWPQTCQCERPYRQTFRSGGSVTMERFVAQRTWIPYWLPSIGFVVLPLIALVNYGRRARRRSHNACPTCGYDLTANTSGICPECGTSIAEKGEVTA